MIFGDRIRLRAIEKSDLPPFTAWLNDPEVRCNLTLYLPISLEDEDHWFDTIQKQPPEEHPLVIEVKKPEGWVTIGNIGLFRLDWRIRSAEIGIMIGDKGYWNQGYGRDSMHLMLKHSFETLNLNRIFLRVLETNLRAVRAYENAGFKHEGRMRQAAYLEGGYVDLLLMSVLRSEWLEIGKP